jgi:hypothetical protein
MIGPELHLVFATASLVAMGSVAAEGAWRAVRDRPPGRLASAAPSILLLALAITMAGGLGILLGGGRPRELLHFVYAGLAVASVPIADSVARHSTPRRRALARLAGALVGAAIIARLFGTG